MWFILFNPISIFAWFIVIITFLVPRQYLGLYVWFLMLSLLFLWIDIRTPEIEEGVGASLGRAMIFIAMKIVVAGIILRIIVTFTNSLIKRNKEKNSNRATENKLISKITLSAYGILSAWFLYLFFTKFLENYQPAWEAYTIVIITSVLIFAFIKIIKDNSKYPTNVWIQNSYFFGYRLCLSMIPLVVISFSFSIIALIETNKVIKKYEQQEVKYCIQSGMTTWLDLTPLTTWNKSTGDYYSRGKNHAVLVIQSYDVTDLYRWSYKLKKWDYITRGFKPSSFNSPSSLECILDKNYSKTLPLLVPKTSQLDLGNKKFNIPYEYSAAQQKDILLSSLSKDSEQKKLIMFLALPPSFSSIKQIFTKLPDRYSFHTNVYVSALVNNQDLENRFKPYVGQKIEELEGKYGLNRRSFAQIKYEFDGQKVVIKKYTRSQYYTTKEGFINTLIECSSSKKNNMNCQHSFIDNGLIYHFNHSEKDLKNWNKLEIALINKVKSWEIP